MDYEDQPGLAAAGPPPEMPQGASPAVIIASTLAILTVAKLYLESDYYPFEVKDLRVGAVNLLTVTTMAAVGIILLKTAVGAGVRSGVVPKGVADVVAVI